MHNCFDVTQEGERGGEKVRDREFLFLSTLEYVRAIVCCCVVRAIVVLLRCRLLGVFAVLVRRQDAPQSLLNTFLITTNAFKNKRSPHITPTIAGMKTFLSNCEAATAATGSLMINAFMQSMYGVCRL